MFHVRLPMVLSCAAFFAIVESPAIAQDVPPEMKVLNMRIGTWNAVCSGKSAVWTPDGLELKGVEKIESTLKGRFIQGKTVNSDKSEAAWMATYDIDSKTYRFWFFNSFGSHSQSKGQWGERTRTMTWTGTNAERITTTAHWRFIDADTHESDALAKDRAGKIYLNMTGKLTRQK